MGAEGRLCGGYGCGPDETTKDWIREVRGPRREQKWERADVRSRVSVDETEPLGEGRGREQNPKA